MRLTSPAACEEMCLHVPPLINKQKENGVDGESANTRVVTVQRRLARTRTSRTGKEELPQIREDTTNQDEIIFDLNLKI